MAGKLLKAALFVGLVLSLQNGFRIMRLLGVHRHVFNHTPGPCRIVPGVEFGSEDITVTSKGIAFITSGLKYAPSEWKRQIKSRIFTFDFNRPERNVSEVTVVGPDGGFTRPPNYLGISIWEDDTTGKVRLFVINRAQKPSVEIFEYQPGTNTLQHKETVTSENIYSPNNIVAVSDSRFYVSNDLWVTIVEVFSPIRTGTVAYYDGQAARIVARGFTLANGINQSPDGRYVYVAGTFDDQVSVFNQNDDGSLTLLKKIDMYTAVDNIEVDKETGDLWLGCLFKPIWLFSGRGNMGPAQVLRVRLDEELRADVKEVLADDGQLLSGSSVARPYRDQMLVGTITNKLLYCDLRAF